MCDPQQKVKNKKTDAQSQKMKHHHHSKQNRRHPHHHQQTFRQSDEDDQDTHSTAEDSLLSDHLPHHQHPHRYRHRPNHGRLSLSETSFASSYDSSSSTFSSSSATDSSSSASSSSNSSSTSASSSSLSFESSSEGSDRFLLRRPQHSQSCTNIYEKYNEDGDDTAPLIGSRGHAGKQKRAERKSSHNSAKQGTQKKTQESTSFRKSKSMEALTCPPEKEGHANDEEREKKRNEVRKNLMKEKMKFSAFLNEITRQVLSPMRLTTLGVTDAQKTSSTEPTSVRSNKSEINTGRSRQQSSRPVSADSVDSRRSSHAHLSKSKSSQHHHRSHRSPDSPDHMQAKPRSCTDINCLERHPSCSQTSQHCSQSPCCKRHRRRNQEDHIQRCYHHSLRRSPSHHGHPRDKSPYHHHRRCYSPVFYPNHGDSDSSSYRHDKRSPRNHHDGGRYSSLTHPHRTDYHDPAIYSQGEHHSRYLHGYHNHGNVPRCEEHHNRASTHQIRNSKDHHRSNQLNTKRPTTPRHGNQAHSCDQSDKPHSKHHRGDHRGLVQHHSLKDQHHHGIPHSDHPNRHHGDQRSGIQQHNQRVHGDGGHRPHQRAQQLGDHHGPGYQHQQRGSHHSPNHQHQHGDDHKDVHQPDDEESQNSYQEHRYGAHHSPNRLHYHGDKHSPNHEDHHSNLHQHSHREQQSAGHQRRDHHSPNGQHHSRDHTGSHRQHHRGEHKNSNSHHQHEGHHSRTHENPHGDPSHHEPHQNKRLSKNEPEHEDKHNDMNRRSAASLPPHQKKGVLSCKLDSTKKMTSPSGRDEEQTDFTGPSVPQETTHEVDKIMILQEDHEGLQQSYLKSEVQMESFGEFLNSHKLLEEELQRTRVELSNLTESFKILHENCSSTQQTNSLLEQKLNSVTKSMEGERERLSRRISALTEKLAGAKYANNADTLHVNSALDKTNDHFHPDDAISQVMLPLAPPPVQFMDSHNYEKVKAAGQEQCLGSVPEEEESDWSEIGEEIPRFILTSSNRSQAWMHREGNADKDSESGGEEIVRYQSPRPLQVPHFQFTIHNEILPAPPANACLSSMTGENTFRITASQNLGSTMLIRSTSLEEIPLACHQMPKELRGTEAMMDLHHSGDEASDDMDNEIIHHWRTNNKRDGRSSEVDSAPCSLQYVEQMLNQFMCEPQRGEGICQSRWEMHGWTGGIAEEVLGGEQTQL
ncbi:filaggrin [Hippocampus zosterae]|uniref:filaggrin n=1 Tax=Hippocampus zosterae TaxID=109293 RepID=UPI00223D4A78|nr:filaggrin [Hippocampus zosterae]XP_051903707.1 filaggrin [Hippocampus zosterae]